MEKKEHIIYIKSVDHKMKKGNIFEICILDFEILVFNCGLHDIKRAIPEENYQIDIASYEKNLNDIYKLANKHQVRVIFITTTPVDDERHNCEPPAGIKRYDADVEKYNKIAVSVARKFSANVIDLNTFTKRISGEKYIDHVHFIDDVRKKQAAFIAGSLSTIFSE